MFRFKQFTIDDSRSALKVGTDGVLLGAWLRIDGTQRHILDVGTGSGVIAVMMAQRSAGATVIGIDIDAPSVEDAKANMAASPWADRIAAFVSDFRGFGLAEHPQAFLAQCKYDIVVSNPPFFVNSLKAPDSRRSDARHNDALTHKDLIEGAVRILSERGRLALILPCAEADLFIKEAAVSGLSLSRICRVSTLEGGEPRRSLMEFTLCDASNASAAPVEESLAIQNESDFTLGYKSLTKDFYLKF